MNILCIGLKNASRFFSIAEKELGCLVYILKRLGAELHLERAGLECEFYPVFFYVFRDVVVKGDRVLAERCEVHPIRRRIHGGERVRILVVFDEDRTFRFVAQNVVVVRSDPRVHLDEIGIDAAFSQCGEAIVAVSIVAEVRNRGGFQPEAMSRDGGVRAVADGADLINCFIRYLVAEAHTQLTVLIIDIAVHARVLERDERIRGYVADRYEIVFHPVGGHIQKCITCIFDPGVYSGRQPQDLKMEGYMTTYKEAGVDIEAGEEAVSRIQKVMMGTWHHLPGKALRSHSSFAFVVDVRGMYMALSADGIGTKVRIATILDRHDTIGQDAVAMNVNDIAVTGITPAMFVNYIGMGKQLPKRTARIVAGMADACSEAGVALVGGEMAEMPDIYRKHDYDVAGFAMGVEPHGARLFTGERVQSGMRVWGAPSSGVHSNGFSLVRRVFGIKNNVTQSVRILERPSDELGGKTLGEVLLTPTMLYPALIERVKRGPYNVAAFAHITGGGIPGNVARVLPNECMARIDTRIWEWPAIFRLIRERGNISRTEMYRTFNCGIGLVAISPSDLSPEGFIEIGEIVPARDDSPRVKLVS